MALAFPVTGINDTDDSEKINTKRNSVFLSKWGVFIDPTSCWRHRLRVASLNCEGQE